MANTINSNSVSNSIDTGQVASKLPENISQEKNPATASLDNSTSADARINQNFDDFLLLLTTQLKNQDPTQPLDTNQFVMQLTALNQVEQQLATNKNLEQLVAASSQAKVDSGINLIGKAVEAKGNSGFLVGGNSAFVYNLPKEAANVNVTITDGTGQPVFSGAGSTYAGKNLVTWSGTNSFNGKTMPDGEYKILVKATDAEGKEIEATTYTTGRASSVEIAADGSANIVIGTSRIPYSDVVAVSEIPVDNSAGTSNTNTNNSNATGNTADADGESTNTNG